MSARLRRRSSRSGQSLAEFALVLPIFLVLFFAVFDLGSAVFTFNSLTNAAREGARLAIVNQDTASIIARAETQVSVAEINAPNVTIDFYNADPDDGTPNTSDPCAAPIAYGCLAVVSFESTYRPLTPIIGNILFKNGVTFKATSILTVEYSCPNATHTAAQCPKQP
jgi:Flp pilus assembly protein TadG